MTIPSAKALRKIKRFDQLLAYLRDELDWPTEEFEFEDLTFDWEPDELGIDEKVAAKIDYVKQLRPLVSGQEWGIFFIKFEPKRLPMVAMRRLLNKLVVKKRASNQTADRAAWQMRDLLFISQYGEGDERKISFAQFTDGGAGNLPTLKVLSWGETQTDLTLDFLDQRLRQQLRWPDDPTNTKAWHDQWSSAFTLRHGHVIKTSAELASSLAVLAKSIYEKAVEALEVETENGPLTKLLGAFRQALIHDLEPNSFADMYAQTITYGLFSAAASGTVATDDFGGRTYVNTERMVQLVPPTNPFLRDMLSTFLTAGGEGNALNFDELGINDVVDLLNDEKTDLNSVLREFGNRKRDEDPVVHFYEEFLKAYNSRLRFQRGVFYTPQPVVSYIVRSVHELLKTEFGLEDGLADTTTWGEMVERFEEQGLKIPDGMSADAPFVQILDPATGTATFLVEVIDVIHKTMIAKWKKSRMNEVQCNAAWNKYVPKFLLPRIYGYEVMMAPYAIAHMKIGLKLTATGYRFGSDERARIFLTNALEPPNPGLQKVLGDWFPALAHEAGRVDIIKSTQKFSVVIGNPPYAGFSANNSEKATALVEPYKFIDGEPLNERKHWLQDDYKKFIRKAELSLNSTGLGVLGFITNHGFIDDPTARGMRWNLLQTFGKLFVYDLHGSLKKKEVCPSGSADQNVFDIEPGVSISLFCKSIAEAQSCCHADLWGTQDLKYEQLRSSTVATTAWSNLDPVVKFFLFIPADLAAKAEYEAGIPIVEIFKKSSVGCVTARDALTIHLEADTVWKTVNRFAELDEEAAREEFGLGEDVRDWKVVNAQSDVRSTGPSQKLIAKLQYRPFDIRFTYYTGQSRGFIGQPQPKVMTQFIRGKNFGLAVGRQGGAADSDQWNVAYCTTTFTEFNLFRRGGNTLYPLFLYPTEEEAALLKDGTKHLNINPGVLARFKQFARENTTDVELGEQLFKYIYAILYCGRYRHRFYEFLKRDFPRIPFPANSLVFDQLSQHGNQLFLLHTLEFEAEQLGRFSGTFGDEIEKVSYKSEVVWINKNQSVGFHNVAPEVWEFKIGGYQPLEKWLKDRQAKGGRSPRPGRKLTQQDIEHYQKMVVAIRETIRLMGEIDEVIDRHGGWPDAFVTAPLDEGETEETPAPFA